MFMHISSGKTGKLADGRSTFGIMNKKRYMYEGSIR